MTTVMLSNKHCSGFEPIISMTIAFDEKTERQDKDFFLLVILESKSQTVIDTAVKMSKTELR